jgi:hypothetical protein
MIRLFSIFVGMGVVLLTGAFFFFFQPDDGPDLSYTNQSNPLTLLLEKEFPDTFSEAYLTLSQENDTFRVIDYTRYVDYELFAEEMPTIYRKYPNDTAFFSDLASLLEDEFRYTPDALDSAQFPHETLQAKEGDCEDLSLLIASMLVSVPKEWHIYLVYMDQNHPYDLEQLNHVIVSVSTDSGRHYIDPTARPLFDTYEREVDGWHFEVTG